MYAESTSDVKRMLLNEIIQDVRCTVRRGEKTGEIEFRLRGDGSIKKEREEAKKGNGESGNLPSGSSTPHVAWLREQDSNLQPCGYGRFQDFHPGPDYLITLAFGCPKLRHLYVRVSGADGAYRREIRIP